MTSAITDTKRTAIAEKLADIRVFQNLFIANEQQLINECNNSEICERFQKMLADDRKNLEVVETVITACGMQAKPKETVQKMVRQSQDIMNDAELTLYEKVGSHELIKHAQVMSGLMVHEAARVIGSDISQAVTPLNTVNFENRSHQEQLQGMLEALDVRERAGQDADGGGWSTVQDTVATLSRIVGTVVIQSSNPSDRKIQEGLRIGHRRTDNLFLEVDKSNDLQEIEWSMLRNFTKT